MLLDSKEFQRELFEAVQSIESDFVCFSAFIKEKALRHSVFLDSLQDCDVTIVSRWEKRDLIVGASDREVYELCKERGWKFGINLNLHGKLYLIDQSEIFLGSANLTQRGLHIGIDGNFEFGTKIPAENADLSKVRQFVDSEVTWMDDNLYQQLVEDLDNVEQEAHCPPSVNWPPSIFRKVYKPVEYLWVQELVFTPPEKLLHLDLNDEKVQHDFNLLELDVDDISERYLQDKFRRTRVFRWLHSIVEKNETISFGGITHALHNCILDDPKPYRVNIKDYNQVIFQWALFLNEIFEVHRPGYSQLISLKKN